MTVEIEIRGITPLLMHSQRTINTEDPLTKEIKKITAKGSKKTEEDAALLQDLQWEAALYHQPTLGLYVPAMNFKRCIMDGGKLTKKKALVERAIWPIEPQHSLLPFRVPGWPGIDAARRNPDYRDVRVGRIDRSAVTIVRPRFPDWSLLARYELDTTVIDMDLLKHYVREAGRYVGLGDYRPTFGRFELVQLTEAE